MMPKYTFFLLLGLLLSCSTVKKSPNVMYYGALRNIMHRGDISSKVKLEILQEKSNVYALGALKELKGEIQIIDSKPYSTYVNKKGELAYDHSLNREATLLVYAQVRKWKEYKIPKSVASRSELEKFLEKQAISHGLNLEQAFPFLLEGILKSNNWHVISWNKNDKVHTHKKHIDSGIHKVSKNSNVMMVGFYSQNHVGIFTHHTTKMHLHFVSQDKQEAGHSDNMILGENTVLKLPFLTNLKS